MEDMKNSCFFITPISEQGTGIRKRSDDIFDFVLEPIARKFGYKAVRADKISEQGLITDQIINYVVTSPIVIADLTGIIRMFIMN